MFKNIFRKNDEKFDIDYLDVMLITTALYVITKAIKKNNVKIADLKKEIEELKSFTRLFSALENRASHIFAIIYVS